METKVVYVYKKDALPFNSKLTNSNFTDCRFSKQFNDMH